MSKTKKSNSIKNTKALLEDIIKNPKLYSGDIAIVNALSSQGQLAKHRNDKLNIIPLSLNTFKAYADELTSKGFNEINSKRLVAIQVLNHIENKDSEEKSQSKKSFQNQVVCLLKDKNALKKQNILLSKIIQKLKSDLKRFAELSQNNTLIQEYELKNKQIESMLNFTYKDSFE